jgi:hypothetical protein
MKLFLRHCTSASGSAAEIRAIQQVICDEEAIAAP